VGDPHQLDPDRRRYVQRDHLRLRQCQSGQRG
jgi:hypothetical protein